jgi:hypothetical protein
MGYSYEPMMPPRIGKIRWLVLAILALSGPMLGFLVYKPVSSYCRMKSKF